MFAIQAWQKKAFWMRTNRLTPKKNKKKKVLMLILATYGQNLLKNVITKHEQPHIGVVIPAGCCFYVPWILIH